MHKLLLSSPTVTENPHLKSFLEGTAELRPRGSVYDTYVSGPTHLEEFTFRTTSKDLHLKLGILTHKFQLEFARMLKWHFDNCVDGQSQLLLFEREKEDAVLITKTREQNATIFTLAPAR